MKQAESHFFKMHNRIKQKSWYPYKKESNIQNNAIVSNPLEEGENKM